MIPGSLTGNRQLATVGVGLNLGGSFPFWELVSLFVRDNAAGQPPFWRVRFLKRHMGEDIL